MRHGKVETVQGEALHRLISEIEATEETVRNNRELGERRNTPKGAIEYVTMLEVLQSRRTRQR